MHPSFAPHLIDVLSIILIDLLLAGDNALVIAMVVRGLPDAQRRTAIACGAALAVALRVAITVVAAEMLTVSFVRLLGGALVAWIAVKVLVDSEGEAARGKAPRHVFHAMALIVVADITMSTDNVLAIAGASHGSIALIVFGLAVSIPFVVFSSTLLSVLMDRYPVIVQIGAAVLGKVAVDMMLTDPFVEPRFHPSQAARYLAAAVLIVGILITGRILSRQGQRELATK